MSAYRFLRLSIQALGFAVALCIGWPVGVLWVFGVLTGKFNSPWYWGFLFLTSPWMIWDSVVTFHRIKNERTQP